MNFLTKPITKITNWAINGPCSEGPTTCMSGTTGRI